MVHGTRPMTPHSTAVVSMTFSTVNTLLTVFGDRVAERGLQPLYVFGRDGFRRLVAKRGTRCTRRIDSFAAMPLGFNRFAFAVPSRNRDANSFNVQILGTSSFALAAVGGICPRRAARALWLPPSEPPPTWMSAGSWSVP